MKTLIIGGNGQLGSAIITLLNEKQCPLGKIHETYDDAEIICTTKSTLDITHPEDIKTYLLKFKPDVVINAAAYTHVDHCESNIDLCFNVNTLGPRNLAIACDKIQAKLIHISTDYIFDGQAKLPYREFDIPNPINIYGKAKYLGEEYVKQLCSRYFIIRTSWLYGVDGKNFVNTILHTSKERNALKIVSDQIGTPTYVMDLAYHLLQLAATEEYGTYHCTGNGECSWSEFAKAIIDYARIDCIIQPISSRDYGSMAQRPLYSTLDNMMLRCTIGDKMRDWKEALKDFIENLN